MKFEKKLAFANLNTNIFTPSTLLSVMNYILVLASPALNPDY